MKRSLLFSLILIFACSSLMAQWKPNPRFGKVRKNNVTFELQGGAGALLIDNSLGAPTKPGFNVNGTVGYTVMFNKKYGFHTGLGFTYLNSGYKTNAVLSYYLDDTHEIPMAYDVDENGNPWSYSSDSPHPAGQVYFDSDYDVESKTGDVSERYSTMMLEIPIQLAYAHENWWYNAGFKLSLPVAINADYSYGTSIRYLTYIHHDGTDLSDNPFPIPVYENDITVAAESDKYKAYSLSDGLKVFVDLALEGGYRIPRGKNGSLYFGLYLNYALNSASPAVDGEFLEWTLAPAGQHDADATEFNGVLRSTAIDSYKRFTGGIKIYYNLSFGERVR